MTEAIPDHGWFPAQDESTGEIYWVNDFTGESSWEEPQGVDLSMYMQSGSDEDDRSFEPGEDSPRVVGSASGVGQVQGDDPTRADAHAAVAARSSEDSAIRARNSHGGGGGGGEREWEAARCPTSGEIYFIDTVTGQSQWELPDVDEEDRLITALEASEKAAAAPGAQHTDDGAASGECPPTLLVQAPSKAASRWDAATSAVIAANVFKVAPPPTDAHSSPSQAQAAARKNSLAANPFVQDDAGWTDSFREERTASVARRLDKAKSGRPDNDSDSDADPATATVLALGQSNDEDTTDSAEADVQRNTRPSTETDRSSLQKAALLGHAATGTLHPSKKSHAESTHRLRSLGLVHNAAAKLRRSIAGDEAHLPGGNTRVSEGDDEAQRVSEHGERESGISSETDRSSLQKAALLGHAATGTLHPSKKSHAESTHRLRSLGLVHNAAAKLRRSIAHSDDNAAPLENGRTGDSDERDSEPDSEHATMRHREDYNLTESRADSMSMRQVEDTDQNDTLPSRDSLQEAGDAFVENSVHNDFASSSLPTDKAVLTQTKSSDPSTRRNSTRARRRSSLWLQQRDLTTGERSWRDEVSGEVSKERPQEVTDMRAASAAKFASANTRAQDQVRSEKTDVTKFDAAPDPYAGDTQGWEAVIDPQSNALYFFCEETGETAWELEDKAIEAACMKAIEDDNEGFEGEFDDDYDEYDMYDDEHNEEFNDEYRNEGSRQDADDTEAFIIEGADGWAAVEDPVSQELYYCNINTGETTWELPEDLDIDPEAVMIAAQAARGELPPSQADSDVANMADLEGFDVPDEMSVDGDSEGQDTSDFGTWDEQMARMDDWRRNNEDDFADLEEDMSESYSDASSEGGELEDGWEEVLDPFSGNVYYFQSATGQTTWHRPTTAKAQAAKKAQRKNQKSTPAPPPTAHIPLPPPPPRNLLPTSEHGGWYASADDIMGLAGHLVKRDVERARDWKRRFFVMKGDRLEYYKIKADSHFGKKEPKKSKTARILGQNGQNGRPKPKGIFELHPTSKVTVNAQQAVKARAWGASTGNAGLGAGAVRLPPPPIRTAPPQPSAAPAAVPPQLPPPPRGERALPPPPPRSPAGPGKRTINSALKNRPDRADRRKGGLLERAEGAIMDGALDLARGAKRLVGKAAEAATVAAAQAAKGAAGGYAGTKAGREAAPAPRGVEQHCFAVTTLGKTLCLCAQSAREKRLWVRALLQRIHELKTGMRGWLRFSVGRYARVRRAAPSGRMPPPGAPPVSAPTMPGTPAGGGQMLVQRCVMRGGNWRKSYTMLQADALTEFTDETLLRRRRNTNGDAEHIPITSGQVEVIHDIEVQGSKANPIFALKTIKGGRLLFIRAPNIEAKRRWIMTLEQLLAAQRYFVLLRQRRGPLVPPTKTGFLQQRARMTVMQSPAVSLSGPNGVNVLADTVTAHPSHSSAIQHTLSQSMDGKKGKSKFRRTKNTDRNKTDKSTAASPADAASTAVWKPRFIVLSFASRDGDEEQHNDLYRERDFHGADHDDTDSAASDESARSEATSHKHTATISVYEDEQSAHPVLIMKLRPTAFVTTAALAASEAGKPLTQHLARHGSGGVIAVCSGGRMLWLCAHNSSERHNWARTIQQAIADSPLESEFEGGQWMAGMVPYEVKLPLLHVVKQDSAAIDSQGSSQTVPPPVGITFGQRGPLACVTGVSKELQAALRLVEAWPSREVGDVASSDLIHELTQQPMGESVREGPEDRSVPAASGRLREGPRARDVVSADQVLVPGAALVRVGRDDVCDHMAAQEAVLRLAAAHKRRCFDFAGLGSVPDSASDSDEERADDPTMDGAIVDGELSCAWITPPRLRGRLNVQPPEVANASAEDVCDDADRPQSNTPPLSKASAITRLRGMRWLPRIAVLSRGALELYSDSSQVAEHKDAHTCSIDEAISGAAPIVVLPLVRCSVRLVCKGKDDDSISIVEMCSASPLWENERVVLGFGRDASSARAWNLALVQTVQAVSGGPMLLQWRGSKLYADADHWEALENHEDEEEFSGSATARAIAAERRRVAAEKAAQASHRAHEADKQRRAGMVQPLEKAWSYEKGMAAKAAEEEEAKKAAEKEKRTRAQLGADPLGVASFIGGAAGDGDGNDAMHSGNQLGSARMRYAARRAVGTGLGRHESVGSEHEAHEAEATNDGTRLRQISTSSDTHIGLLPVIKESEARQAGTPGSGAPHLPAHALAVSHSRTHTFVSKAELMLGRVRPRSDTEFEDGMPETADAEAGAQLHDGMAKGDDGLVGILAKRATRGADNWQRRTFVLRDDCISWHTSQRPLDHTLHGDGWRGDYAHATPSDNLSSKDSSVPIAPPPAGAKAPRGVLLLLPTSRVFRVDPGGALREMTSSHTAGRLAPAGASGLAAAVAGALPPPASLPPPPNAPPGTLPPPSSLPPPPTNSRAKTGFLTNALAAAHARVTTKRGRGGTGGNTKNGGKGLEPPAVLAPYHFVVEGHLMVASGGHTIAAELTGPDGDSLAAIDRLHLCAHSEAEVERWTQALSRTIARYENAHRGFLRCSEGRWANVGQHGRMQRCVMNKGDWSRHFFVLQPTRLTAWVDSSLAMRTPQYDLDLTLSHEDASAVRSAALSAAAAARDRDQAASVVSTAHAAAKAALRGGKATVKVVREVEVMGNVSTTIFALQRNGRMLYIDTSGTNQPGHDTKSTSVKDYWCDLIEAAIDNLQTLREGLSVEGEVGPAGVGFGSAVDLVEKNAVAHASAYGTWPAPSLVKRGVTRLILPHGAASWRRRRQAESYDAAEIYGGLWKRPLSNPGGDNEHVAKGARSSSGWKYRFFVLSAARNATAALGHLAGGSKENGTASLLSFFGDATDVSHAKGHFLLSPACSVCAIDATDASKSSNDVTPGMAKFELVTPIGALRLAASSTAARDAWVAALQAHINRSAPSALMGGALSLMAASTRRQVLTRAAADAAAAEVRRSLVEQRNSAMSEADIEQQEFAARSAVEDAWEANPLTSLSWFGYDHVRKRGRSEFHTVIFTAADLRERASGLGIRLGRRKHWAIVEGVEVRSSEGDIEVVTGNRSANRTRGGLFSRNGADRSRAAVGTGWRKGSRLGEGHGQTPADLDEDNRTARGGGDDVDFDDAFGDDVLDALNGESDEDSETDVMGDDEGRRMSKLVGPEHSAEPSRDDAERNAPRVRRDPLASIQIGSVLHKIGSTLVSLKPYTDTCKVLVAEFNRALENANAMAGGSAGTEAEAELRLVFRRTPEICGILMKQPRGFGRRLECFVSGDGADGDEMAAEAAEESEARGVFSGMIKAGRKKKERMLVRSGWRERWFELRGGVLRYYAIPPPAYVDAVAASSGKNAKSTTGAQQNKAAGDDIARGCYDPSPIGARDLRGEVHLQGAAVALLGLRGDGVDDAVEDEVAAPAATAPSSSKDGADLRHSFRIVSGTECLVLRPSPVVAAAAARAAVLAASAAAVKATDNEQGSTHASRATRKRHVAHALADETGSVNATMAAETARWAAALHRACAVSNGGGHLIGEYQAALSHTLRQRQETRQAAFEEADAAEARAEAMFDLQAADADDRIDVDVGAAEEAAERWRELLEQAYSAEDRAADALAQAATDARDALDAERRVLRGLPEVQAPRRRRTSIAFASTENEGEDEARSTASYLNGDGPRTTQEANDLLLSDRTRAKTRDRARSHAEGGQLVRGYLQKRSVFNPQKWNARFFELSHHILTYFMRDPHEDSGESNRVPQPRGRFELSPMCRVQRTVYPPDVDAPANDLDSGDGGGAQIGIELVAVNKVLHIACTDERQRSGWLESLQQAIYLAPQQPVDTLTDAADEMAEHDIFQPLRIMLPIGGIAGGVQQGMAKVGIKFVRRRQWPVAEPPSNATKAAGTVSSAALRIRNRGMALHRVGITPRLTASAPDSAFGLPAPQCEITAFGKFDRAMQILHDAAKTVPAPGEPRALELVMRSVGPHEGWVLLRHATASGGKGGGGGGLFGRFRHKDGWHKYYAILDCGTLRWFGDEASANKFRAAEQSALATLEAEALRRERARAATDELERDAQAHTAAAPEARAAHKDGKDQGDAKHLSLVRGAIDLNATGGRVELTAPEDCGVYHALQIWGLEAHVDNSAGDSSQATVQLQLADDTARLEWAGRLQRSVSIGSGGEAIVREHAKQLAQMASAAHCRASRAYDAARSAVDEATSAHAEEALVQAWTEAEDIDMELASVLHAEIEAKKTAAREQAQKVTLGFKGSEKSNNDGRSSSKATALHDRARHVKHLTEKRHR